MKPETIATFIVLAINIGTLIWGAARIVSKLEDLTSRTDKQERRLDTVILLQVEDGKKLSVLWDGHTERRLGADDRRTI